MVEEEVNLEGANEYEAPVQIAMCGEDEVPEMSEYEKLRERNIREREEMMKEVMEEINEAKQEMFDNAPKRKIIDSTDEPKSKRRRVVKSTEVVQVRRSERERKQVSYEVDEDDDRRSRRKKKNLPNYLPEASNYEEVSSSAPTEGQG